MILRYNILSMNIYNSQSAKSLYYILKSFKGSTNEYFYII